MEWSHDKVRQIPPMYCDALLALKPIMDSRTSVVRITAIPIGHIYNAIAFKHNLNLTQVKRVLHNLAKEHLIEGPDEHGFVKLTAKGEDLIYAIAGDPIPEVAHVPPFPKLAT